MRVSEAGVGTVPCGMAAQAGGRRWREARRRVFRMSMAIVMGPTPPGTGVMRRARFAASANSTSPTSRYPCHPPKPRPVTASQGHAPPQGCRATRRRPGATATRRHCLPASTPRQHPTLATTQPRIQTQMEGQRSKGEEGGGGGGKHQLAGGIVDGVDANIDHHRALLDPRALDPPGLAHCRDHHVCVPDSFDDLLERRVRMHHLPPTVRERPITRDPCLPSRAQFTSLRRRPVLAHATSHHAASARTAKALGRSEGRVCQSPREERDLDGGVGLEEEQGDWGSDDGGAAEDERALATEIHRVDAQHLHDPRRSARHRQRLPPARLQPRTEGT